ncbi:hypothetical protein M407DRAFT_30192 [Tulasnella calospora MUT 4182]|uniref:UPF3 domain-containing protein n=1 Tax=Tulasnella calospora MUT 4182 TaxID=1051891 RepID=A0A0C3KF96_9AGAM|nr:hypothetical protein M407DRAFT_30192 [Tulasnella calospora MUT 4182]
MSSIKTEKPAKPKSSRPKRAGPESRLKVVVRRLPPNLPEGVFWESVTPWVDAQTTSWKQFWPGKLRPKGVNKENVLSRAYIVFNTEEQLKNFHRDYDGHLFRDKSGNESQAVVEFAPFQKVPLAKAKVDQRQGSIQEDEDFKSFITSLSQVEPTEAEKLAMAPPPDLNEKMTTLTPLLASLLPNKDSHAAESRDKHHETRPEEKSASGKARRRKEKEHTQKERIDDAEFSRGPVRQDSTRPEEASKKGQSAKERAKNPARKPSESADAPSKSKGKTPASPVRPTRSKAPPGPQQGNDAAGPSTSAADGSTSPTQHKARPKFKFDGILAPGGGRPRPGRSESGHATPAASSPTTETAPGEAPNPPSRRPRKGKDKEKDSNASSSGPARTGSVAEHSGPKHAGDHLPAKPPAPMVVHRILQRPTARIDDEGATPDAPTSAGIIPVQMPPRGRGRGGGRGRGRGRGRGGAPAPES